MPNVKSSKDDNAPIFGFLAGFFAACFVLFTVLAFVAYLRNVASDRAYRRALPCSQLRDSTPASNCWYEQTATVTDLYRGSAKIPADLTLQSAGRQDETFQFGTGTPLLDSIAVGDTVNIEIWHDNVVLVRNSGISAETTYVPYPPRPLLGWVVILGSVAAVLAAVAVGAFVRAYEPGWRRVALVGVIGVLLGPPMAGFLLVVAPILTNLTLLVVSAVGAVCCATPLIWVRALRDRPQRGDAPPTQP